MSLIVWLHIWHFSWYKFHIRIGGSLPVDFQAHVQLTSSWLPVPILSIHYHHNYSSSVPLPVRFRSHLTHTKTSYSTSLFRDGLQLPSESFLCILHMCKIHSNGTVSTELEQDIFEECIRYAPTRHDCIKKIPLEGRGVWEYHTSKWNNFLH